MLTLWIVVIVLGVLELFETVLLMLLLRALGEVQQRVLVASGSQPQSLGQGGLDIGEKAPLIAAVDPDSNVIKLEDFQEKHCILAFISPGCSACAGTIKAINTLLQVEKSVGAMVIGSTDRELNRVYMGEYDSKVPILAPISESSKELYHVQMMPFVFMLDDTGVIRSKGVVNRDEHLQDILELAGVPVSVNS